MYLTPDCLAGFAKFSGIDPSGWRAWHTESMLSVSGIGEQAHALALRNYFTTQMALEAEINEPVHPGEPWSVVAIPAFKGN